MIHFLRVRFRSEKSHTCNYMAVVFLVTTGHLFLSFCILLELEVIATKPVDDVTYSS